MEKCSFENLVSCLEMLNPDALYADGFEDALVGFVTIFNKTVALYDRNKCLEILVADGASEEEAVEYFEYNVVGAYVGENTPGFATICRVVPGCGLG